MVIVDGKNTLSDLSRAVRTLGTYLVFSILGFLVASYYFNEQVPIQSPSNYTITCLSPAPKVNNYIVRLPSTGPDGASYR